LSVFFLERPFFFLEVHEEEVMEKAAQHISSVLGASPDEEDMHEPLVISRNADTSGSLSIKASSHAR
jgi:hypothetical protein